MVPGADILTPLDPNVVMFLNNNYGGGFVAGNTYNMPPNGPGLRDTWFSGWWYSAGRIAPAQLFRHSERALCVFWESIYNRGGLGALPALGGGALPGAPALPASYQALLGNVLGGGNHPLIQPDAVEIYNAIQTTPNVVAVIIHIKNILRMCSNCASLWQHFTQLYFVVAGNGVDLGDRSGGQVRFIFVIGSGNGGAIEIYQ